MKKFFAYFFLSLLANISFFLLGSSDRQSNILLTKSPVKSVKIVIPDSLETPASLKKENRSAKSEKIWFKFKEQPLFEIVNYVANAMKLNVVLPQGQDALTVKITLEFPEKISPQKAYDQMLSILRITGYSVVPQNDFYYIVKNDSSLNSQPLPLYINTLPEDLPDTDQIIRYMYYLSNIQVSSGGTGSYGGSSSNALEMFLKGALSSTTTSQTGSIIFDSSVNGMLITDYSRTIKSVMAAVIELDTYGFTDAVEIIQLKKTDAVSIATLFKTLISSPDGSSAGGQGGFTQQVSPQAPLSSVNYFSQTTRIIPIIKNNTIIIMGKKDAIKRIVEFTEKYIDIDLETGENVLHIYPLQYLNAKSFAPILTQIVSSQSGSSSIGGGLYGGTSGQSSGSVNPAPGQQYFKGVVIVPEIVSPVNVAASPISGAGAGGTTATPPQPAQQGGNRLLIAARQEDWGHIKKLIDSLDRPQPQVAVEVLIVDITLNNQRTLGSQIRNKKDSLPPGVNFQTSTLGAIQLTNPGNPGFDALMANLLQIDPNTGNSNLATQMTGGSFALSLDNPNTGVSWLLQILNSYTNTKVLSHPFAVVLNNQLTTFIDNETRLLPGNATVKKGATFAPITPVPASLSVTLTPQINGDNFINLSLNVGINEWTAGSSNSQKIRTIVTNANVRSGQILVLGGLTQTTVSSIDLGTPILKDIPLIGWLFKSKNKTIVKTNLAVFICPRIIESSNGYCDPFTQDKFLAVSSVTDPGKNLTALRDPITRWFFGSNQEERTQQEIIKFTEQKMFQDLNDYKDILSSERDEEEQESKQQFASRSISDFIQEKKTSTYCIRQASEKTKNYKNFPNQQPTLAKISHTEENEMRTLLASLDDKKIKGID